MSFAGLRVLSLESRRAVEIAQLIRNQQGEPFVAPSMREVPLEQNQEAFRFLDRLAAGELDMMILLTGVGTRMLWRVLGEPFVEGLRKVATVARGPKPAAALREMAVPISILVPEPNTWKEVLAATDGRPERHIAVQEYGRPNIDLMEALRARGAQVTAVRVYQWDLPEDTAPLRRAAEGLASGDYQVAMFTTATQIVHLMQMAREMGLDSLVQEGFSRLVVASIGPTTTEALEEYGIHPDLEPSHPKMGLLVQETAQRAWELLSAKGIH